MKQINLKQVNWHKVLVYTALTITSLLTVWHIVAVAVGFPSWLEADVQQVACNNVSRLIELDIGVKQDAITTLCQE